MRYAIVVGKAENNYSAYVPDLPGCVATGDTVAWYGAHRAPFTNARIPDYFKAFQRAIHFRYQDFQYDWTPKRALCTTQG